MPRCGGKQKLLKEGNLNNFKFKYASKDSPGLYEQPEIVGAAIPATGKQHMTECI